jgi:SagB-type dehydrogenase family enzyme
MADSAFLRRATPSAGGLFPLQLHLFARRITGLPEARFQYLPVEHALLEAERLNVTDTLASVLYAYPFVADANAVVAFVAQFGRQQEKYGPRGYRYTLLEAGHCAQNMCLRAVELGLSTLCIGGFADSAVNRVLRLDPTRTGVVYMVAAGYPRNE